MRAIVWTKAFRKDYKRYLKRESNLERFKNFIELLAKDKPLPGTARPHKLVGNYIGLWECHIEPDWLLIYEYGDNELKLRRTGTHSDLFK